MAILTIEDRKDGTGVNATVAGLSGTGTLWTSFFSGNQISQAFANSGSFSADGTQQIAMAATGPYFAVLIDDSGPTAPVAFRVTDGSTCVHYRCVQEVRNWILSLSLPRIPSDPTLHKVHKSPRRSLAEFKIGDAIQGVHYYPTAETRRLADNVRHEVEYPVTMVVIDNSDGDDNRLEDGWLSLRQTICQSIHECGLAAVEEIDWVMPEPGPIFPTDQQSGVEAQSILFRCHTEQISIVQ